MVISALVALSMVAAQIDAKAKMPLDIAPSREVIEVYDAASSWDKNSIDFELLGTAAGIRVASDQFYFRDKSPSLFCIPPKLGLSSDQLVLMVRNEIEQKPEWGEHPVTVVLLAAFIQNFPCKSDG